MSTRLNNTTALSAYAILNCMDIQAHIMRTLPTHVVGRLSRVCKSMYVVAADTLNERKKVMEHHDDTITRLRQKLDHSIERNCVSCAQHVQLSSNAVSILSPWTYEAFGCAIALSARRLSFALADEMRSYVRICIHRGEIVSGKQVKMNISMVHSESRKMDAHPVVYTNDSDNILGISVSVCLNALARKLQLDVCTRLLETGDRTDVVDAQHTFQITETTSL